MKVSYFLFISLVMFSCKKCKESKDDNLCTHLVLNDSELLKLAGYYFYNQSNTSYSTFFLYSNGIVLSVNTANGLAEMEQQVVNGNILRESKLSWGVYSIRDSNIFIEKWYPGNNKL